MKGPYDWPTTPTVAELYGLMADMHNAGRAAADAVIAADAAATPEHIAATARLLERWRDTTIAVILHCTRYASDMLREFELEKEHTDPGMVSKAEIARIGTNYLGDACVQMALGGFLARFIDAQPKGDEVTPERLYRGIELYVEAVKTQLESARLHFNLGFRVSDEGTGPL